MNSGFAKRAQIVGLIEVGSESVRYMVAQFDQAGGFKIDRNNKDSYSHGVDPKAPDESKLQKLWRKVDEYKEALLRTSCDRIVIYGTELCRILTQQSVPPFVTILSAENEAYGAWAAGFMGAHHRINGRYTIIDQGGGSTEIVSANWTGRTIAGEGRIQATLSDMGHKHLATLYAKNSASFTKELRGLLAKYEDAIATQVAVHKTDELILIGTAATKLAFNIKFKDKENDKDDYRPHDIDVKRPQLTVKEIADYYREMDTLYKTDPKKARYKMDHRVVATNHYEQVMSGAILLMLLMIRLGHQKATVTVNSTRYGMGFLEALGLLK